MLVRTFEHEAGDCKRTPKTTLGRAYARDCLRLCASGPKGEGVDIAARAKEWRRLEPRDVDGKSLNQGRVIVRRKRR